MVWPLLIFAAVVVLVVTRAWGWNEAIPATCGAIAFLLLGYVRPADEGAVVAGVWGPGLTVISTIIMSSVLDRAGVLRAIAFGLARRARGSGTRLFWMILLLGFGMTMFFNNDGSVLITTPIVLALVGQLGFTREQSLPYLIGCALVATASSAPIGVSNLANLIALRLVGLDLNRYTQLLFVPSMVGIAVCAGLLFVLLRGRLPSTFGVARLEGHAAPSADDGRRPLDRGLFVPGIAVVVAARAGFFVAAFYGVQPQYVAVAGALILLALTAVRRPRNAWAIVRDAPWHILLFAFGMYTVVYGLHRAGLSKALAHGLIAVTGHTAGGLLLGTAALISAMSCVMNNLPAVMLGTFMLRSLHLAIRPLQISYLSLVLGSDVGSLLLPTGTLASLIWMHLVGRRMTVTWRDYVGVAWVVIPPSLAAAALGLWAWGAIVWPR